jgi:hypothetical protein
MIGRPETIVNSSVDDNLFSTQNPPFVKIRVNPLRFWLAGLLNALLDGSGRSGRIGTTRAGGCAENDGTGALSCQRVAYRSSQDWSAGVFCRWLSSAEISTHFDHRLCAPVDAPDRESCRPDFAVAIYPGHLWTEDNFELNRRIRVTR